MSSSENPIAFNRFLLASNALGEPSLLLLLPLVEECIDEEDGELPVWGFETGTDL